MVSFTTTFVAVIGFVSLAQPIAAAPLAMVAASAVGGLVSGHKIRDGSILWERATASGGTSFFPLCPKIFPLSPITSLINPSQDKQQPIRGLQDQNDHLAQADR